MFDQVLERENLLLAWKQVRGNAGAPGIDGMRVGDFPDFIRKHWEKIQDKLRDGSYRPSPVKRVFIPIGMPYREARELDCWLRRRVRLYYWKQWGRPKTRRRNLLRLGTPREKVKMASRSRKGPWRMSHNSIVQRAMTDAWLSQQGVPSIQEQWKSIRYPDTAKAHSG